MTNIPKTKEPPVRLQLREYQTASFLPGTKSRSLFGESSVTWRNFVPYVRQLWVSISMLSLHCDCAPSCRFLLVYFGGASALWTCPACSRKLRRGHFVSTRGIGGLAQLVWRGCHLVSLVFFSFSIWLYLFFLYLCPASCIFLCFISASWFLEISLDGDLYLRLLLDYTFIYYITFLD